MKDPEDWKARLDEIRELKYLLTKAEERPFLKPWAFGAWGILVWLGTGLNTLFAGWWGWGLQESFHRLWIPLFLVGVCIETWALLSQIRKDQIPWISPSFLKLLGGLCGFWFAATVLFLAVFHSGNPLPAIFLLLLSISFFWLASISFTRIYFVALLTGLAGFVFYLGNWTSLPAYVASGVLCGGFFLWGGVFSVPKGKPSRE